jgi:hypothetical protein
MIKHIVMWKFKETVSVVERQEMKQQLLALQGRVSCLTAIEVGMDFSKKESSMDMVLCSEFQTKADLQAYAMHPEHLKVVAFVQPLVIDRTVVDYEI